MPKHAQDLSAVLLWKASQMPEGLAEDKATASKGSGGVKRIKWLSGLRKQLVNFIALLTFHTLKVKTTTPLKEVLLSLPDGDLWEDAKVLECLDYVLKSKLLKVPQEYKDVFPRLFGFGRG